MQTRVGIVKKCENGIIRIFEGNSGYNCRRNDCKHTVCKLKI